MISPLKYTLLPVAALVMLLSLTPAKAESLTLLTVTGSIENTNRGPIDPDYDKLFVFNDVAFENAMQFDASALAALPQQTVRADFPKGGDVVEFTGPLLSDVLGAAGGSGDLVIVRALDGYAVEVPFEEMAEAGAVIAYSRDGKALGIGDFGPVQVVFPRADREDLTEMPDDWWVYQVYNIAIE
ncbi:MAG: molybdopterin-dependent oxidoreductase [Pseudomonadota bacterium]